MTLFMLTLASGVCCFGCRVTSKHVWDNASICCDFVIISKECWSKDIFGSTTHILPMTILMFTVANGVCGFGCCVTSKHVWDNASICCYLAMIPAKCWCKDIFGSTTHILTMIMLICPVALGVSSFGCNAPARAQLKFRCFLTRTENVELP